MKNKYKNFIYHSILISSLLWCLGRSSSLIILRSSPLLQTFNCTRFFYGLWKCENSFIDHGRNRMNAHIFFGSFLATAPPMASKIAPGCHKNLSLIANFLFKLMKQTLNRLSTYSSQTFHSAGGRKVFAAASFNSGTVLKFAFSDEKR